MSIKILEKKILADVPGSRIVQIKLAAQNIAVRAKAGQFIVLMAGEEGERIPLTIAEIDANKTAITIIFQEAGFTTRLLGKLNVGDSLYALAGPLGHPTEIHKSANVIIVGGGVGMAEIYPVTRAFKAAGNRVTTILGARTKELLILEQELKKASDNFYITTDDGSYGKKGFVTDILKDLLARKSEPYSLVYAVGPIPMMRKVAETTKPFNIKTLVSLNALMVDATGMCGCCRVSVGGKTKFSCVDGPEFDAHEVDWDELTKRNKIYYDKEQHICRLNNL
ncbi:MAG: sulfide/dihydroorotate dehydrogenase-like FAD/NAD-binding protein [Candidatus Omnitrophica bacterium]|jgi:ferredoxin--NADP+ reductase|nr:sulfide/dihydroorotate dehydrogenase-like FAD/NAD-binding protein [Candidatus Omnitrophota bacterium]